MAMHKWFRGAFEEHSELPAPKKRRLNTTADEPTPSPTLADNHNDAKKQDWLDTFAPFQIEDLAVHTKKIDEIRGWLEHYKGRRAKQPGAILLVTGPPGSGKTATVKVLAAELGWELVEWITPVDIELANLNCHDYDNMFTYHESQADRFKSFLFKSSRYNSLFNASGKRILLVEDLPNTFLKHSAQEFSEILERYLLYGRAPLIFIATDTKSRTLDIAYNLFPDRETARLNISTIAFNAVSRTLLKKAIGRLSSLLHKNLDLQKLYTKPTADIIDTIILSSNGDVRNAVRNFQFSLQKGAPSLRTEKIATKKTAKSRGTAKQVNRLELVGLDESVTLMHALGRVLYPKIDPATSRFTHAPEDVAANFSSEPNNFLAFLHANYLPRIGSLDAIATASDHFSRADILLGEYRDNALALTSLLIVCRGLMVDNDHETVGLSVTDGGSGWRPMCGPRKRILPATTNRFPVDGGYGRMVTPAVFASDMRYYTQIIERQQPTLPPPTEQIDSVHAGNAALDSDDLIEMFSDDE